MARLPSIPNRFVTIEEPKQRISEADISAPFTMLGKAMDKAGDGMQDVSAVVGEEAGKKAVVYDAEGNPTYQEAPQFTGAGTRAYNRSAQVAYLAASENKAAIDLQELRLKHANDPAGFAAAAKDYRDRRVAGNMPEAARVATAASIDRAVTGHMTGVMTSRYNRDTEVHGNAMKTRMGVLDRELTAMDESGTPADHPDYKTKLADRNRLLDEMQADARFKLSRESVEEDKVNRARESSITRIGGVARRHYLETGDINRASKMIEEVLDDPTLKLAPEEKLKYRDRLTKMMMGSAAVRQENVKEVTERANAAVASLIIGDLDPGDESISGLITQARGLRMRAVATKLDAERETAVYTRRLQNSPRSEHPAILRELQERLAARAKGEEQIDFNQPAPGKPYKTADPVATDMPPHARAFLNAIAGGESGGRYDIRYTPSGGIGFSNFSRHPGLMEPGPHGPSSAAGRYQFTQTTWNGLGGGAFTPENQDRRAWILAQQDYQKTTGRNLDADLRSGGVTSQMLTALAPTWQAFKGNHGRHIATYNESLTRLSGPGGGVPSEAGAAWAAQRGEATAVYRQTYDRVAKIYNGEAKDIWEKIKSLPAGQNPTMQELNDLRELAPLVTDPKVRKEINEGMTALSASATILEHGAKAREIVAELERAAGQNAATAIARDVLDRSKKALAARDKLIAEDPSKAAQTFAPEVARPTAPLDFTSPAALAGGLEARQRNTNIMINWDPTTPVGGPLNDADIEGLRRTLANGSTEQVVATLHTLNRTLTTAEFNALFKGKDGFKDALIGVTRSSDKDKVEAAFTILDGLRGRDPIGFKSRVGDEMESRLLDWRTRRYAQTREEFAKESQRDEDPTAAASRKKENETARDEVKDLTSEKLAGRFVGTSIWARMWNTVAGPDLPQDQTSFLPMKMVEEFKNEYARARERDNDPDRSATKAMEKLQVKWGPSPTNQGAIMEYPPEKQTTHYPAIDGSHAYLKEQADKQIRDRMLAQTGDVARYGIVPGSIAAAEGRPPPITYRIISDKDTEREVSSGVPPSYAVVVLNAKGSFELIDLRMKFDPKQALEARRQLFTQGHNAAQETPAALAGTPTGEGITNLNAMGRRAIEERRAKKKAP